MDSYMLLELLDKYWVRVHRIGLDAERRGEKIGMKPSWDESAQVKSPSIRAKTITKARQQRKKKAAG
jgi:hypothetical protein